MEPTVLDQDVQALLNEQRSVEDDQTKAEREDIITRSDFEEGSNRALEESSRSRVSFVPWLHRLRRNAAGCRCLTYQSRKLLLVDGSEHIGSWRRA